MKKALSLLIFNSDQSLPYKKFTNLFLIFSLGLTLVLFHQNCSQPYDLDTEDYQYSSSELENAVTLDFFKLSLGGEMTTNNPIITLNLNFPYAKESNISFKKNCKSSEWRKFKKRDSIIWGGPDGNVNIYVKFRNFGKEESPCFKKRIVLDTLAPSFELKAFPEAVTRESFADFHVEVFETLSGVGDFSCVLIDQKSEEILHAMPECQESTKFESLADGEYRIEFSATDLAGNTSDPFSYSWVVDTNAPDLQITRAPPAFYNQSQFSFEFVVDADGGSVITTVECRLDGGDFLECESPHLVSGLDEGPHSFEVRVTDEAGNFSRAQRDWIVDMSRPVITLTNTPQIETNKKVAEFQFSAEDVGESGIANYFCSIDGGSDVNCNSLSINYSNLSDGEHNFAVYAMDKSGNQSSTASFSWKIDSTPPSLSFTSVPEPFETGHAFRIRYTIEETGPFQSGIESVTCTLDGEVLSTNCDDSSRYVYKLTFGSHIFSVTAFDRLGNSRTISTSWFIDDQRPNIEVLQRPDSTTISRTATFRFRFDDIYEQNGVQIQGSGVAERLCRLNSEEEEPCGLGFIWYNNLSVDRHTLRVRVIDQAGNQRTESYQWVVRSSL